MCRVSYLIHYDSTIYDFLYIIIHPVLPFPPPPLTAAETQNNVDDGESRRPSFSSAVALLPIITPPRLRLVIRALRLPPSIHRRASPPSSPSSAKKALLLLPPRPSPPPRRGRRQVVVGGRRRQDTPLPRRSGRLRHIVRPKRAIQTEERDVPADRMRIPELAVAEQARGRIPPFVDGGGGFQRVLRREVGRGIVVADARAVRTESVGGDQHVGSRISRREGPKVGVVGEGRRRRRGGGVFAEGGREQHHPRAGGGGGEERSIRIPDPELDGGLPCREGARGIGTCRRDRERLVQGACCVPPPPRGVPSSSRRPDNSSSPRVLLAKKKQKTIYDFGEFSATSLLSPHASHSRSCPFENPARI